MTTYQRGFIPQPSITVIVFDILILVLSFAYQKGRSLYRTEIKYK